MTQAFKCQSCGAPLNAENVTSAMIQCPFCSNSVIVPEELRVRNAPPQTRPPDVFNNIFGQAARLGELGQLVRGGNKIAAIKLYRELFGTSLRDAKDAVERLERGQSVEVTHVAGGAYESVHIDPAQFPPAPPQSLQASTRHKKSCLLPVLLILLMTGASSALILYLSSSKLREAVGGIPFVPSGAGNPSSPTGFASVTLEFGSEGIGAGQFKDARSVGVDAEGRIYVGEYMGGRVQVFDAQGKYLAGWMVDEKMPLRGMAVDRKGTVYIVQRGVITRYEGMTGKSLGTLTGGSNFEDVTLAPDGSLIATSGGAASDNIVRFNSSGKVTQTIQKAISGQTDRSELNMRLATDGLGNIYALGSFNSAVFKFTRDGRFTTRIGGEGNEPGQFRALLAVAVDGQGRVFVSDSKGIQVFDTNGRYLELVKVEGGVAFGMVFNDRNELVVAARNRVIKFTINKSGR
jgi:hypothetical protein